MQAANPQANPQDNPLFKRAMELQMEIDEAVKLLSSITDPQEQVAIESTIKLLMRERHRLFAVIGETIVLSIMDAQGKVNVDR